MLFYTDGISEAKNNCKEIYGDRILRICKDNLEMNSEGLIDNIVDDVVDFSNNDFADDVAIMMMEIV